MLKILLAVNKSKEQYMQAVEACGAIPVPKYIPDDCVDYDGLILCGGNDISPEYYGEALNGSVELDGERDRAEFALLKRFFKTGKPILGICRGMQLLNVALGGSLVQDLPCANAHRAENGVGKIHSAVAEKPSLFYSLYGERFVVNSFHHQAVARLGEGLRVTLRTEDGEIIEGYEHVAKPYFGVQWHPEKICLNLKSADTVDGLEIFRYFVKLCEKYKLNEVKK